MFLRDLIRKPSNASDEETDLIDKLKRSDAKKYIFGAGSGGKKVASIMKLNGIELDGFIESKLFFKEGKKVLDKPVFLYDEIKDDIDRRIMVMAVSGKGIEEVIVHEQSMNNDVLALDIVGSLFEMDYTWLCDNLEDFQKSLDLFTDDLSKETFLSYINHRAHCIDTEVRPLYKLFVSNQYFNDLYCFEKVDKHVLVDCGAWIGDSAEEYLLFLENHGFEGKVYAFEPDPDNFSELCINAERWKGKIVCLPYALGANDKEVFFEGMKSSQSHVSGDYSGIKVEMKRGDELLKGKRIGMIKMDLEGGELDALTGMKDLIIQNSPILAICVYHKVDDLIKIPQMIRDITKECEKEYRFYLRHHSTYSSETVMYAIPQ